MGSTIWISHRGYCEGGATENTRASFDAAVALGFRYIETDIHLTIDGHLVLHHDDELTRTFSSPKQISVSKWEDLTKLSTSDSQKLLTVSDLFASFPSIHWTFDIKPSTAIACLKALRMWASDAKKSGWLDSNVRFLLWSREAEGLCRELFPSSPTLAREPECYRAGMAVLFRMPHLGKIQTNRIYSIPPYLLGYSLFKKWILRSYWERGAKTLAYLPRSEAEALEAKALGFNEILTNGRIPQGMSES